MDQYRDAPGTDGWREAISRRHIERAALQDHLDQLYRTLNRLHALRPAYQDLIEFAHQSRQDAYLLEREMSIFVIHLEQSTMPREELKLGSIETVNEHQAVLLT